MSTDPVIAALKAALSAGENLDLNIALGERYMVIGQPAEAVAAATRALAEDPAHIGALKLAAEAAEAAGMSAKAASWRRLHTALSGSSAPQPQVVQPLPPASAGSELIRTSLVRSPNRSIWRPAVSKLQGLAKRWKLRAGRAILCQSRQTTRCRGYAP